MNINKRKTILIIISVLTVILISIVSVSCMGMGPFAGSIDEMADQGIEVFEVKRGNIYQIVSTTGIIDSKAQNTYTLQVSGEIISALEKGEIYRKGDILVEVDNYDGMLRLDQIEKDIKKSESSLKTAKINYQKALDANHIAIQLADINTEKAEDSTESALNSLENANKSAELSYESAERALEDAKEVLQIAQSDPTTAAMQLAQYESSVKSAEEKLESTKTSNSSSTSQAESSYEQSITSQSTTYWSNLYNSSQKTQGSLVLEMNG